MTVILPNLWDPFMGCCIVLVTAWPSLEYNLNSQLSHDGLMNPIDFLCSLVVIPLWAIYRRYLSSAHAQCTRPNCTSVRPYVRTSASHDVYVHYVNGNYIYLLTFYEEGTSLPAGTRWPSVLQLARAWFTTLTTNIMSQP